MEMKGSSVMALIVLSAISVAVTRRSSLLQAFHDALDAPENSIRFMKIDKGDDIPEGWHLTTKDEATAHKEEVASLLGAWEICELDGGFKIDGSGYGNNILPLDHEIGHRLITNEDADLSEPWVHTVDEQHGDVSAADLSNTSDFSHRLQVSVQLHKGGKKAEKTQDPSLEGSGEHFRKIGSNATMPDGWHTATKDEAEANHAEVAKLIDAWEICKLADGYKINGSGYGHKIQPAIAHEGFGQQIITDLEVDVGTEYTGPFDTDIPGTGYKGMKAANVGDCQSACTADIHCKAIQFSATDTVEWHDGNNCFLHNNQKDDAVKYQTFQIWKKVEAHLKNETSSSNSHIGEVDVGTHFTGPFDTDIPGTGYNGMKAANVENCASFCTADIHCKAFQFSATDTVEWHHGNNCFKHNTQKDDAEKYQTFQIWKKIEAHLENETSSSHIAQGKSSLNHFGHDSQPKSTRFKQIETNEPLEEGWRVATKEEVEQFLDEVKPLISQWDICRLADGYKIDGAGYGNKIHGPDLEHTKKLGHTIITNVEIAVATKHESKMSSSELATLEHDSVTDGYEHHNGYISVGGNLSIQEVTVAEARQICSETPGCEGFTHYGPPTSGKVQVFFKGKWDNFVDEENHWTSYKKINSFKKIGATDPIPDGWHLATKKEVTDEANQDNVKRTVGEWGISELADGYKIGGSGYKLEIAKKVTLDTEHEHVGDKIITTVSA